MMVKVCSLNVRGLRDPCKSRAIFSFLRSKQYDIYMLQETHGTIEIKRFGNTNGKKYIFSRKDSRSRGFMIMLTKYFKSISKWNDHEGRILFTDMKFNGSQFSLINVYGPIEEAKRVPFLRYLE